MPKANEAMLVIIFAYVLYSRPLLLLSPIDIVFNVGFTPFMAVYLYELAHSVET